jgi:ketosteroid isomerase-like protein
MPSITVTPVGQQAKLKFAKWTNNRGHGGSGILGIVEGSLNVRIVRRMFRLRGSGDIDEAMSFYSEDAENRPITTDRVLRGHEEIRRFLEDTAASGTVLEPSTFRFETNEAGQVAVFGRLRVRGPDGIKDMPAAWIYTLEDGKIVRAEGYRSTTEAEEAFGARKNGAAES